VERNARGYLGPMLGDWSAGIADFVNMIASFAGTGRANG
jgi:hypothetical protein